MLQRTVIAALGLVCVLGEVRAECPQNVLPGALSARIDARGLELMKGVLLEQLPSSIDVPPTPQVLMDCPAGFDDTVFTPHGATIDLGLRSLDIRLDHGAIEMDLVIDISTQMQLEMVLCAAPDATCPAALDVPGVTIHARLEPSIDSCTTRLPITQLDIDIDPYSTLVQLSSCGLYDDLWQLVYDWFRELIVNTVVTKLEEATQQMLPALMESFTQDMLADGFEIMGMRFDVAPELLTIRPDAMTLQVAANVTPLGPPASCLPAGASLPPELAGVPTADLGTASLSVAGSKPFLQRAIRAAWISGLMCFDSREFGLDLGGALDVIAPGATLDATVVIATPPTLELGVEQNRQAIRVVAPDIRVALEIQAPNEPLNEITVQAGVGIAGEVFMDAEFNSLMLDLQGIETSGMTLDASHMSLVFSEQTITALVENVVMPMFAESIGPLPLTGGLFVMSPVAVQLEGVDVSPHHLRADIDLWPIDRNDRTPPHTVLGAPPSDPSPATLVVEVASVDDKTPVHFMRHLIEIDGVLEETPRPGMTLVIAGLKGGVHDILIRAVDLNDNIDSSAVELVILVDDVAPVVSITEAPLGIVGDDRVTIRFVAIDDRSIESELEARFTVAAIDANGGKDMPLVSGVLGNQRELVIDRLPEDRIIRVTIYAADRAGNEGSAAAVFAVNTTPTLGCTAAGSVPIGLGPLLVLVAGALLRRSRRRRP